MDLKKISFAYSARTQYVYRWYRHRLTGIDGKRKKRNENEKFMNRAKSGKDIKK